jgi:hypothetical protein
MLNISGGESSGCWEGERTPVKGYFAEAAIWGGDEEHRMEDMSIWEPVRRGTGVIRLALRLV